VEPCISKLFDLETKFLFHQHKSNKNLNDSKFLLLAQKEPKYLIIIFKYLLNQCIPRSAQNYNIINNNKNKMLRDDELI